MVQEASSRQKHRRLASAARSELNKAKTGPQVQVRGVPGHILFYADGPYMHQSRAYTNCTIFDSCTCGWNHYSGSAGMLIPEWTLHHKQDHRNVELA